METTSHSFIHRRFSKDRAAGAPPPSSDFRPEKNQRKKIFQSFGEKPAFRSNRENSGFEERRAPRSDRSNREDRPFRENKFSRSERPARDSGFQREDRAPRGDKPIFKAKREFGSDRRPANPFSAGPTPREDRGGERRERPFQDRKRSFGGERKSSERSYWGDSRRNERKDSAPSKPVEVSGPSMPKPVTQSGPVAPMKTWEKKESNVAPKKNIIASLRQEKVSASVESTMTFEDFEIEPAIGKAIEAANFTNPTPIQEKSLPFTLEGRDLLGCAQTGTGKTAAFVIPLLQHLIQVPDSQAVVIAPTRELAAQILETLRTLTAFTPEIGFMLMIGGTPFGPQVRDLKRGPRIVVATPGRLVDHLQQGTIRLNKVGFFVLDEADRMFDMGFAPQIKKIMAQLPEIRQTLMFSATFSKEVRALALQALEDPEEVSIGAPSQVASGVEQAWVETTQEKKFDFLMDELNEREGSVLIFVGMKYKTEKLARQLAEFNHKADCIHGDRSVGQRRMALERFRRQEVRILVATDVAARGLDIPHVAHVVNYDLPQDPEDYVHRIGRTARAGALGKALSLVGRDEREQWKRIQRILVKNQEKKHH